jgi:hypothetical protein
MRYSTTEALLTAASTFGRLATLSVDKGVSMAERSYEQSQARAVNSLDNSYSGEAGTPDQVAQLARAQVYALLTVGAAIKDLAESIRERS